jgi:glycine dehydrogenase subunit 1
MSPRVAAVYFENPSYLGFIESQGEEISSIAHAHGALTVVGVDPTSLGILAAPPEYGADIVCGDTQPLGNHMSYGGGLCGFVATRDELPFVVENPLSLVSAAPGQREGEFGFGRCTDSRTVYEKRERSADLTGTTQNLLSISTAVYLALMGPQGMQELGEAVMQKSHYAANLLSGIDGIKAPLFSSVHFKEFVVNFDETGRTVCSINKALLDRRIFGGKDLSAEFPELGNSALYCVTEIHTKEQIQGLCNALEEVLRS